jgi:hypothetical protein
MVSTLTRDSPEVVKWSKTLKLPLDDPRALKIAEHFNIFSSPKDWHLRDAGSMYAMSQVQEALVPLEFPLSPIFLSVDRSRHLAETVRSAIEDYFSCGSSYRGTLDGIPFCALVRKFIADELCRNVDQRKFEQRIKSIYGKRPRDRKIWYVAEGFRNIILDQVRDAISETPFTGLFYLIAEGAERIAMLLVDAVFAGETQKAEQLDKLLRLYAVGLPIFEEFRGHLVILEA